MSTRKRSTVIGVIIIVILLTFAVNCDPVRRHKMLTFFFDGVPPLEAEARETEEGPADANSLSVGAKQTTGETRPTWYVHEPTKDCKKACHGRAPTGGFSRQTRLMAPVPELCYKCHNDDTASAAVVHGPVAVGQCLFCHNPHKSKNRNLLKKPEPELCYLCHDREMIEAIVGHSPELLSECSNCHDGHTSTGKSLLRAGWKEKIN